MRWHELRTSANLKITGVAATVQQPVGGISGYSVQQEGNCVWLQRIVHTGLLA